MRSVARIAGLIVAALLVGAGLQHLATHDDVTIRSAYVSDDGSAIELILESCNADLVYTIVEEPHAVTLSFRNRDEPLLRLAGDDCLDARVIELREPLDGRAVFDGSPDRPVPVRSEGT